MQPTGVHMEPKVVWLLGHPVSHSLSPLIQNAAFQHCGLDVTYGLRDVESAGLGTALDALRTPACLGANITVPHKQQIVDLLDDLDPHAASIGAVNTVVNTDGTLTGYNTDAQGFLLALRDLLEKSVSGLDLLVLGAGGAARAVVAALVLDGASSVHVANRTLERAQSLCTTAKDWGQTTCVAVPLDQVRSVAAECQVIVNTTSLGMAHSVKHLPIDVDILRSGQVVFDLVYGAGPTPLVAE